jgi:3',5'-cyclic AMP phosphodiesterase CpdA
MRTLLHLSDLHFGRIDAALLEPVAKFARELNPDCVVVSGDLTQRARSAQFLEARAFLDQLASPQVVVPGNHDVPLINPLARFASPFEKWRRYIGAELEPEYVDEEIAVVGLNSARSLTIKGGRISRAQMARLRERLCTLDANIVKAVVSHHPFDLSGAPRRGNVIGRAMTALKMFAGCGADLLLAGHMHVGTSTSTEIRGESGIYSAVVVQAGTATSTRGRGQANSFNVIRIDPELIQVEPVLWVAGESSFRAQPAERFAFGKQGWTRVH